MSSKESKSRYFTGLIDQYKRNTERCERADFHAADVEPAMLKIAAWLIRGAHRIVMHRHDGCWRAIDQAVGSEWNAESLTELVKLMEEPSV